MSDTILALVREGDWPAVVEACFPEPAQAAVGETLVSLLNSNGSFIQDLYDQYEEQANGTSVQRMGVYFPTAEEPTHKPLADIPNVTQAIVTALYAQQRMSAYVTQVDQDVEALESYLATGDDQHGEQLYNWLLYGRTTDGLDEELAESLNNASAELTGYDDETEGIKDRGLADSGLSTRNAINCLDDFGGRTFPFVRSTCEATDNADSVLDIGTGTGVLAAVAALNGAETVIGIELNPITAILARRVMFDLEQMNLIPEETVEILWGDALKFGSDEYEEYAQEFDAVLSENMSTGMFYEPQTQMIRYARDAGLATGATSVIPHAMANGVELISLSDNYTPSSPAETLIRVQDQGGRVEQVATRTIPYDYIPFTEEPPRNIMATVRESSTATTTVDAIAIHSIIKLGNADYIQRNQNTFLNHDLILHLNEPLDVYTGDDLIVGLAYSYGDPVDDGIFEVYHRNAGSDYDSRFAVSEEVHQQNKESFRNEYGFDEDTNLRLGRLSMDERIRCRRAVDGVQEIWRQAYDR